MRALALLAALGAGCAAKQDAPATVARANALLAASPRERGDLVLRCEPADAQVVVDGVEQGKCSDYAGDTRSLRLPDSGFHQVQVKKAGHWPYTTYYEPGGTRVTLRVKLRPMTQESGGGTP
jgi:hypothetical protein